MLICGRCWPDRYDLLFYRVLRARFMIWHLVMTAGTLLYVLLNSGLIMVVWPDIPSLTRYAAIWVAISLTNLCLAQFSVQVLEEGVISARIRRILIWSAVASLAIASVIVLDTIPRMRIVDFFSKRAAGMRLDCKADHGSDAQDRAAVFPPPLPGLIVPAWRRFSPASACSLFGRLDGLF